MSKGRVSFPSGRHAARAGMTFLEVVLSVVLLAVVASMVMSSINGMLAAQTSHRQRLGAAELANRLTLQYLDDKRSMPASGAPVVYGRDKYRWEYVERPVTITPARPETMQSRNSASQSLNKLIDVTVRVWLCEQSGGTYAYDVNEPSYVLSRIVNPVALRNPDSIDRMLKNPEAYREFLANLTGGGGTSNPSAPSDRSSDKGGTPRGAPGGNAPAGGKPSAGRTPGGAK